MVWTRPENVEYPRVWLKFESAKSGQKFIIKDLTPEYYDIALGYTTNIFMHESRILGPLKLFHVPEERKKLQQKWLSVMKQNLALVCLTDDDDLPRVVAVHMTVIKEKNNRQNLPSDTKYNQFLKVVEDLLDEGQLFERFGADHYLGSLGLFVLPEFRGQGVATQILKARIEMCKTLRLGGTGNVFSSAHGQAAAERAGYVVFAKRTPKEVNFMELDYTLAAMGVSVNIE